MGIINSGQLLTCLLKFTVCKSSMKQYRKYPNIRRSYVLESFITLAEKIFCLVIFAFGAVGMTINSSVLTKGLRGIKKEMFVYYTNLSNMAVLLYHVMLFVSSFYRQSTLYAVLSAPVIRLSVTLMILITFVIYHFILRSADKILNLKKGVSAEKPFSKKFANLCVHYLVPLFTLAEWIIVAEKSSLRISDGAVWVICPLIYLIFIMLRAKLFGNIGDKDTRFPYFFLDVDAIGFRKAAINVLIIGVVSVAFGMFFVFVTTLFV